MALEGTIKDFGLPDIFQLIGLQRKTGLLTLKHEKENVTVTFETGQVVMADSAAKRLEDRLGNVLVKQGKLEKGQLDEALQTQKATLQRLGHILTTGNYITPKDLKDALQVQVSQIVFRVFRWRDGEYHFEPSEAVDFDRDNFIPMSADFILMEGIRMVDEWPIIEKKIPSMDIVFRTVVDPSLIEVAGGSAAVEEGLPGAAEPKRSAASSASKIRLTAEEERIYRKVDGTRTVQGVIDATGGGEFEVCRILFDLLNRNIIAPVGRGPARDATMIGMPAAPTSPAPGYAVAGLCVLLALGSIFVRRQAPFAVTALPPLLTGSYAVMLDAASYARLERLDRAILAYHLVHGSAPPTLEALVGEGLVDRTYVHDPWARPYHYALTENGYLLSGVDDSGKTAPGTVVERLLPTEKR
jgi:uncharacterized protein DUF4388